MKGTNMIDINLIIAIGGVLIAFFAMYYNMRNGSSELDEQEHARIKADAYAQGKIDAALTTIAETASRTERKLDKMNDKWSDTTKTANNALIKAGEARVRADEAHERIDDMENEIKEMEK